MVYYRLAPGIDVIPLDDDAVWFRSEILSLRVEGSDARVLAERVIPLLDGNTSLSQVARRVPEYSQRSLGQRLAASHEIGVDAGDRGRDAPGRAHLAPRVGEPKPDLLGDGRTGP